MIDRTRPSGIAILGRIITLIVLTNAAAVQANQSPAEGFATALEAVVAAASCYNPISIREDREFMGAVLQAGDRYAFTVGAGRRGRDKIKVRIPIPAGSRVVAFWHTHGAQSLRNQYFSAVDTGLVDRWQKPFYLADYTGVLKVMVPGARTLSAFRARRLGLPAKAGYATGQLVTDTNGQPVRVLTRE